MATYIETEICPICGTRGTYRVTCNGNYDSPSRPREMNPNECPGCAVLKRTNPGVYDMLSKLWTKLLDMRKKNAEHNAAREKELYSQFDLRRPFRDDPLVWNRLAKSFGAGVKSNKAITKKTGNNDTCWVYERAIETLVYKVLEMVEDAKNKA